MKQLSADLFRDFLNQVPEVVYICDLDGKVIYANQVAYEKMGLSDSKADQYHISDFDPDLKNSAPWAELVEELKSFGSNTVLSEYINLKNETTFPVEVSLKWHPSTEGDFIIISARDVTLRVQTEKALAQSKSVIEQSSKLARVGGWDLDLVNQKLHWTDTVREIHEVPDDYEPDFRTAINFYKEGQSRDFMIADITAAIEHGAPLGIAEVELVTARGRTMWVRCVGEVIRENGEVVRVHGSIQDIDKQKRTELKLEQSLRLLEDLTRNVPGAVYQMELKPDDSVRFPFVSAGFDELYNGLDLPDTGNLDDYLNRLVHPKDVKHVKAAIEQSSDSMEPFDIEFRFGDGIHTQFLQSSARPESKDDDTIVWHGYLRDISDQKKHREELKNYAEVTAQQNKRLLNFTYIVSHNIRSHVANLLGILDILKNEENAETRKTFVPLMNQSVGNLDESLRNLNDIVNIQTHVKLTRKTINLYETVEKSLINLKHSIDVGNAEIKINFERDLMLKTNPAYLDSILMNLISNSIKYRSPKRKPLIAINAEANGSEIVISVNDNGLGIDLEKYKSVIFGMYKTFHKNHDANGLGLFITKTQVEALGGKIELESTVDKGTTVSVRFYEH